MVGHRFVDTVPVETVMAAEILVLGRDHGPLQPGGDLAVPAILHALALDQADQHFGCAGHGYEAVEQDQEDGRADQQHKERQGQPPQPAASPPQP